MERKKPVQLSKKGKKLIKDYLNELDSNSVTPSESVKLICGICKRYCNPDSERRFPATFKNRWDGGGGTVFKTIEMICPKCAANA